MRDFTDTEKLILNRIQKDWQITETPFNELSNEIDLKEDQIIQTIGNLKKENIIRDISAIFNAALLGYESALIAFEVPENRVENAASVINAHNGVSHNYLRDHNFNIWFTIALNGKNAFNREIELLAEKAKARDFLILKNEKLFKIGLMLHVGEDCENSTPDKAALQNRGKNQEHSYRPLTAEEKNVVFLLQMDIPLESRPFKHLAEKYKINISEKRIAELGEQLKKERIMRRYGAVLKHAKAGYDHNAMTAWKLTNYDDNEITGIFASVPNISHLYLRTICPGKWEHGLFAMIHARSDKELKTIIENLSEQTGINDYLVLNSLKEFKKERIKYFAEEFPQGNRL